MLKLLSLQFIKLVPQLKFLKLNLEMTKPPAYAEGITKYRQSKGLPNHNNFRIVGGLKSTLALKLTYPIFETLPFLKLLLWKVLEQMLQRFVATLLTTNH